MSPFSRADHARDPLKYPICPAGCVWKQRGNVTGHCTQCHENFEGVKLFDMHQKVDDGFVYCKDPTTLELGGEPLREMEGSWRGPAMPEGVFPETR